MKKEKLFIFNLLFTLILISCEQKSPIDEPLVKTQMDSIYLSCKIDGELIELKSPNITKNGFGSFFRTSINKTINPKDSSIFGYFNEYKNSKYILKIGFSKNLSLNLNYIEESGYKKQVFVEGNYPLLFIDPEVAVIKTEMTKYYGFYITIKDLNKNKQYTSYLTEDQYDNNIEYEYLRKNSLCKITKSTELNSGIYSGYKNTWLIELSFNCKLYENGENTSTTILTEGILKGFF